LAKGLERKADQNLTYSAPDESGEATKSGAKQATAKPKVSRNAPCPCGSGKKYKLCHGRPA
jgi:preprotein translocase subunit SecA